MRNLLLKNAIFNSNEILILMKKGNITIDISDIKNIYYKKPTLINYLLAYGGTFPGRLEIHFKKKR